MLRIALIELLFLFLPCASDAQTISYPLHVGDRWEFGDAIHIQIVSDTLFASGKSYAKFYYSSSGYSGYDTIYRRQEGNKIYAVNSLMGPGEWPEYDFAASLRDTIARVADTSSINGYRWLVVFWGTEQVNVLGTMRNVYVFHSTYMGDIFFWDSIADTLGMVYRELSCLCGAPPIYYGLTGAYIDGQAYGSISGVQGLPTTIPTEFALNQNYPNPFNPVTTIRYAIPLSGNVKLSVYNLLGQVVTVLVDEVQEPGYKSILFDAGNLASGVYVYKLSAGNFTDEKKLLLVR